MKAITLNLTDDQIELLECISKESGRTSADFVKDTLVTILPFQEYKAVKDYSKSPDFAEAGKKRKRSKYIDLLIRNIIRSADIRLKRIGVI